MCLAADVTQRTSLAVGSADDAEGDRHPCTIKNLACRFLRAIIATATCTARQPEFELLRKTGRVHALRETSVHSQTKAHHSRRLLTLTVLLLTLWVRVCWSQEDGDRQCRRSPCLERAECGVAQQRPWSL